MYPGSSQVFQVKRLIPMAGIRGRRYIIIVYPCDTCTVIRCVDICLRWRDGTRSGNDGS